MEEFSTTNIDTRFKTNPDLGNNANFQGMRNEVIN